MNKLEEKINQDDKTNDLEAYIYHRCELFYDNYMYENRQKNNLKQILNGLKKGAPINMKGPNDKGLFEFFLAADFDEGMDFMLNNKEWNPNYLTHVEPGTTPLNYAHHYNRHDLVQRIIDHPNFNPNFTDSEGRSYVDQLLQKNHHAVSADLEAIEKIMNHKWMKLNNKKLQVLICKHSPKMTEDVLSRMQENCR